MKLINISVISRKSYFGQGFHEIPKIFRDFMKSLYAMTNDFLKFLNYF